MKDSSHQQGGLGPRGREILFQPTEDLTAAPAATRDRYVDRVDVLDKVGALQMLPDDMHVMTQHVADFYGVDVELIRYHVKTNRDELNSDGYRVISRNEFESEFGSLSNLDAKVRSIALFPRRAIVRLGMLLRDSDVARRVRDYLLDVEQDARRQAEKLTRRDLAVMILEAEDRADAEKARADVAERQVAELAPVAGKLLDAEGDLSVRDAAQALTRAGIRTGERRLFAVLDEHYGWIKRAFGDGRYRVIQTAIEAGYMSVLPQSHYHPKTGVLVLDPPQPRVTPKGLQRILLDHGGAAA